MGKSRRQLGGFIILVVALAAIAIADRRLQPFSAYVLPVSDWAQHGVNSLAQWARPAFQVIRAPIAVLLETLLGFMRATPPSLFISAIFLLAWQISGIRLAAGCAIGLLLLGFIGVWDDTMITVSIIVASVFICILIGIPLGIAAAKSRRLASVVRPILDVMQTCPAFVYLVPIVMLIGIGNVPGVAVTVIFALPPVVRLTELGIRQVHPPVVEAAQAMGASPREILFDVELPLALHTIMAGINQTLMMALSMVVVASMISVEGLGLLVLRGIGRLDMGLATVGGIGIVVLAMVLDRLTQAIAQPPEASRDWTSHGPVGLAFGAWRAAQGSRPEADRLEVRGSVP
jgi:glycine betaine/proline transport system permease protein